jgi:hypothetical protein
MLGNPANTTFTPYQYTGGRLMHNLVNSVTDVNQTFIYSEVYNTVEFAGNFYLSPKWQFFTQLKMSDNYIKYNDSVAVNVAGIGDLLVMTTYQIFATKTNIDDSLSVKFKHRMRIGGGVILPTGNFRKYSVTGYETSLTPQGILTVPVRVLDYELQPGAGAVSFPLNLIYLARHNKVGVNYMANYIVNTVNSLGYQFANRFSQQVNLMYFVRNKKLQMVPFVGITYETSRKDKLKNKPLLGTGGESVLVNEGLQLYVGKFSVSATVNTPIYQNLWDNQASMQYRTTIAVKYFIN